MRVILFLLLAAIVALPAAGLDLSGTWSGSFIAKGPDGNDHDSGAYAVLKQAGEQISGTLGPSADQQWTIDEGSVRGNKIAIKVKSAEDGTSFECDLLLDGDHLKGPITATRPSGERMSATLDLTRAK